MLFLAQVVLYGLIAAVIYAIYGILRFNTRRKSDPPLHTCWIPIVGHAVNFGISPLKWCLKLREKHGSVFTMNILNTRVTLVADPKYHDDFFKPRNEVLSPREPYAFMVPVFGEGVAYAASYPRMREQLTILAEQLAVSKFVSYVPIIQAETRAFLRKNWDKPSAEVNLLEDMSTMIINTACTCLFGEDVREKLNAKEFAQLLLDMEQSLIPATVFWPVLGYLPTPKTNKRTVARNRISQILSNICDQRQADTSGKVYTDCLQGMLDATYRDGTAMSIHEICGMIVAMMFAGQHTSSLTTTWTLLHLSQPGNKHHLDRLMKEYSDFPEKISYETVMNEMEFADKCVRETVRRDPPLIMLLRKVLQDHKVGGYVVPKGDIIACAPLVSHHDPELFPDGRTWNPDRTYPASADIGFGAGTHKCLGEKFGVLQVKTIIYTILSDYTLTPLWKDGLAEPDYTTMVVGPTKHQTQVRYTKKANK